MQEARFEVDLTPLCSSSIGVQGWINRTNTPDGPLWLSLDSTKIQVHGVVVWGDVRLFRRQPL
jgi:hypothetical protein